MKEYDFDKCNYVKVRTPSFVSSPDIASSIKFNIGNLFRLLEKIKSEKIELLRIILRYSAACYIYIFRVVLKVGYTTIIILLIGDLYP